MLENFKDKTLSDSDFQLCANQSVVGSDCILEFKNIEVIPSDVIIRQLTKSWECGLNCTNRRGCSHFKENK